MAFGRLRRREAHLDRIEVALATMGGFVEQQLSDGVDAFARRDLDLARTVASRDAETDAREREVEAAVIALMSEQRLPPGELRRAMTAIKIAAEMERIGDLAKNTAKRLGAVVSADRAGGARPAAAPVARMGQIATDQLSGALDALFRSDPTAARAVRDGDGRVDDLYNSVFTEILSVMRADPTLVPACTQLVFVAKNFERVGDHATNIAERVHYAVTGEEIEEDRPKADLTSSPALAAE